MLRCDRDAGEGLPLANPYVQPLNRITEVGCKRVNICQNIWSLLSGVGANFAGEDWVGKVGGRFGNGLPTNLIQT